GLAANQIGLGRSVFVYDCPDASGENQVGHVVNPVLVIPDALARPVTGTEGCLSVPGQEGKVSRPSVVNVSGADVHGRPVTVTGTGLLARCLHHETDHLRGVLYVDLIPPEERAEILAAAGLPERPRRGAG
ncbi:MAG: peptide deformylase, partial [Nocardiopsaceae bacterium]|nr:peptide deformylase [Nocardiopsaceae bacterium]